LPQPERVNTAASTKFVPSTKFLENREQRLMGDKQKLELSAMMHSKRMMEQSEKIFD
jgi:hypothetical protein